MKIVGYKILIKIANWRVNYIMYIINRLHLDPRKHKTKLKLRLNNVNIVQISCDANN